MKKLLVTVIGIISIFGFVRVTYALPYYSQTQSMLPGVTDKYNIGTSSPSLLEYNNIWTKNITVSGTCTGCGGGGGSGVFPFSIDSNYNQVVYSTSTPTLWFKSGLFASSTSIFSYASTTAISSSNLTSGNCVQASTGGLLTTIAVPCGLSSLNGLSGVTQTFATSSSAGGWGFTSSGTTHTFNLPVTGSGFTFVLSASPTMTNPTVGTQATTDNSTLAASTAYVTTAVANAIAGVNPAVAVQAATTASTDTSGFTYNNGVSGIGATFTGSVNTALTVDGYTFTALGQRLLVKNDTQSPSGAYNGVYYVTQVQTAILAPILTRALDYDMPSDINNTGAIPVVNGTVNTLTSWLLTSSVNTVGTDPLTYIKFSVNPTGSQNFSQASTTLLSVFFKAYFGGTATTTINSTGDLFVVGSTTLQSFTAVNSTTTSATSTNLFATVASTTNLYATNASTTNLSAATLYPTNISIGIPTTNQTSIGPVTSDFLSGATLSAMDLVYMATSSKWIKTNATVVASSSGMLGINLLAKNDNSTTTVALSGSFVKNTSWSWTVGGLLYVGSTTAATITQQAPYGTDQVLRIVGWAVSSTVIYFDPSPNTLTHT